jgi:AbrB family looped-hinge helix DNA binding protein
MVKKEEGVHIYGTVKVGERGQVVIPAEARKDYDMKTGDLLLVMSGRRKRGLTLVKSDEMKDFAQRLLAEIEEGGKRKA